MSKTLVIGASGQIGQMITETLVETKEEVLKLYKFQRAYTQQQLGSLDELISLLVLTRNTTDDAGFITAIDRSLDQLGEDSQLILTQLEIFTSSYFESLTLDIQRFERALLEYSFFVDSLEIDQYKNNSKIQIIL